MTAYFLRGRFGYYVMVENICKEDYSLIERYSVSTVCFFGLNFWAFPFLVPPVFSLAHLVLNIFDWDFFLWSTWLFFCWDFLILSVFLPLSFLLFSFLVVALVDLTKKYNLCQMLLCLSVLNFAILSIPIQGR